MAEPFGVRDSTITVAICLSILCFPPTVSQTQQPSASLRSLCENWKIACSSTIDCSAYSSALGEFGVEIEVMEQAPPEQNGEGQLALKNVNTDVWAAITVDGKAVGSNLHFRNEQCNYSPDQKPHDDPFCCTNGVATDPDGDCKLGTCPGPDADTEGCEFIAANCNECACEVDNLVDFPLEPGVNTTATCSLPGSGSSNLCDNVDTQNPIWCVELVSEGAGLGVSVTLTQISFDSQNNWSCKTYPGEAVLVSLTNECNCSP